MLRAGYAKRDITPDTGVSLMGYEFRGQELPPGNDGAHDPLYVRALVLDDGTKPAAMVSVDVAVIPTDLAREWRHAIAARLRTTPDRVILSAIHTHSGPSLVAADTGFAGSAYVELLRERILDAAARANGLKYPVEAFAQEALLGLGYNRRVMTPQGVRHCWGPQEFPDRSPGPAVDPTCTVLVLRQTNGPRSYVLWSLGVHPVVLGKTSRCVSADYPGRACQIVEDAVPGSRALFFLGAAGNTHPWIATQEDPVHIEPVGRAAGSFVALLTQGARPLASGPREKLAVRSATVRIGNGEMDLSLWRFGALRIATVPVELFAELSHDLRRRLGSPLFLASVTNGWSAYLPHRKAFAEGGYEINIARSQGFRPGDGEKLVRALGRLAAGV